MKRSEAEALRRKIELAASLQTDEDAVQNIDLFPHWRPAMDVHTGERYKFDNKLWKVLLDHKTQADWTPPVAHSLFVEISTEEWPEWKQPTGAQDAYMKGDKVSFEANHYISLIDNNVWSPTVYPAGWELQ